MKQYNLSNQELTLMVKKSPLLIRGFMFLLSILSFCAPLIGLGLSIAEGNGMHFGFLIGLVVFGLIGFYMLRIALWNSYGFEKITFEKESLKYEANYGWFIDGKKEYTIDHPLSFSIIPIGYVEENLGNLSIHINETEIKTVTKMPIPQLEEVIEQMGEILQEINNHGDE